VTSINAIAMKTETERLKENEKEEIPKSRYALVFLNRVEGDTEEESKTPQPPSIAGGHLCLVCD
jgi:hypothetical protein